jgi:multidrug efflux pump subunit AcrA (membrane-fusion protein)
MNRHDLINPVLPLERRGSMPLKILIIFIFMLPVLPWISFSVGQGQLTALDPNERVQPISATVDGYIDEWYVKEGQRVTRGQEIADLVDNDPNFLLRLERQKDAAQSGLDSAELMMKTANLNLERQKRLFEQGLSSRKEYEKSKIEYSKQSLEYSKNISTLTQSETQLSRQSRQKIIAPRNGFITRILPGERGQLIKSGTPIVIFTPDVTLMAAELWIDGNDASILIPGQTARVQFEGWPALQVPGWPSIAIGTFKGKVYLVDQASSLKGKFRVLVTPVGKWPSQRILRLGTQAKGYIKFRDSYILREVWRQLNGFPAVLKPIEDELSTILHKEGSIKSKLEKK